MAYIKSAFITKSYTLETFSVGEIHTLQERQINNLLRYDD